MKTKNYLLLAITLSGALFSINGYSQGKKKANVENTSQVLAEDLSSSNVSESGNTSKTSENQGSLQNHSKEIQTIIKSEKGVIRGLDFGMPLSKIKSTETSEFEEGKDYIIYKVPINDKETVDVIYYLDEAQKIKGFGIAFMVNAALISTDVEATLIDDFQNYFNERYGNFKTNEKNDDVWTAKDGSYTIEMGDSSEGAELTEIEIEIFKKK